MGRLKKPVIQTSQAGTTPVSTSHGLWSEISHFDMVAVTWTILASTWRAYIWI
jgi:hypothetical protein